MILRALGWALVHGLWQAALIALIVRVALLVARTARVRFAWAWSGLLMIALCFAITLRLEAITLRLELGRPIPFIEAPALASAGGLLGSIELALPHLVLLWACGVLWFGLRAALGLVGVERLRARAQAVDAELTRMSEALAAKLSLARAVAIAECEGLEVPAVIGWLRPLILLPIGLASRLDRVTLEAAIAHELAHVRRHDYLLNAIATAIEALFFHHPCVGWLASVARREREHACDDLVVAHVQSPRRYTRSLLVLEQLCAGAAAPAASLGINGASGASGASLLDRVRRLQGQTESRNVMTKPRLFLNSSRLRSWAPLLVLAAAVGLAAALPACVDAHDPTELEQHNQLERPSASEGKIVIGDPDAVLDIAWLPESVARHSARIEVAARRTGVDPDLLAIIVLLESNGDPEAESPTGARGLMQLMPHTAAEVLVRELRGRGEPIKIHRDALVDPDLNLQLGATYLAWQLDRWGDVELAAAAYNGGSAVVEQWLAGAAMLSEETEQYRARVAKLWQARHAAAPP